MQTTLQLVTELNEEFSNVKNNKKQRNLNTVFANISKTIEPTSDSFPLIMSHFYLTLQACCTEIEAVQLHKEC